VLGSPSVVAAASAALSGPPVDPLALLHADNEAAAPLIEAFSFLAIATSYIGFILGLSGFFADILAGGGAGAGPSSGGDSAAAGGGARRPLPYAATILPPLLLAQTSPDLFFAAINKSGTYGVLSLFGILPAAMAWRQRSADPAGVRLVPGGDAALAVIAAVSLAIIVANAG